MSKWLEFKEWNQNPIMIKSNLIAGLKAVYNDTTDREQETEIYINTGVRLAQVYGSPADIKKMVDEAEANSV